MFSFLVALTLYVALAPIRPALSVADYLPRPAGAHLQPAAIKIVEPIRQPIKIDERRLGIETTAKGAILVDWRSGQTLFEKNADTIQPIASLTKLMTALVVLDAQPNFGSTVDMLASDERMGDQNVLLPGDRVIFGDLFNLALVASSNDATAALARATGLSEEDFVRRMNAKGREIGLQETTFVEPTGLDSGNRASARDVALLVRQALNSPTVQEALTRSEFNFVTATGASRRVRNTDLLLNSFLNRSPYRFLGGKTGSLSEAGFCFGAAAENGDGDRVIAVVLGVASREERFQEVKSLLWWAFDAWRWQLPSV